MKKFIILIPVYNDWKSVFKLLENIDEEIKDWEAEVSVLIVNDASTEERQKTKIGFKKIKSVQVVNMKKNRPGILLSVIACKESFDSVVRVLLEETSTLGVRHYDVDRIVLPRKQKLIMTAFGKVRVKIGGFDKSKQTISPEYEDCKKIALKNEIPVKRVYDEALKAAWKLEV